MISELLKQKVDQWLDGDLPSDEETQLKEALENTPEALAFLTDRAMLHQMLAKSTAFAASPLDSSLDVSGINESSSETRSLPTLWLNRPWVWASTAAAIGLVLISMLFLPNLVASPVELVQKTLVEYRSASDRCYSVRVEAEGRLGRSRHMRHPGSADSKLWVRGTSFVQIFDSSGSLLTWGRDLQGSVWFTISGKTAAIFAANEIPEALEELCDLRTLDVTTLLESLLRDYDLQFIDREDSLHTILAQPHTAAVGSKYGAIEIQIDAHSRLVSQVTLERLVDKRPVAIVSFSLDGVQHREDSFYDVKSHLQDNADGLEPGSRFGKRSELLKEFLLKLRFPNSARIK